MSFKSSFLLLPLVFLSILLAGCNTYESSRAKRATKPLPQSIKNQMAEMDMPLNSPIMVRLFKEEGVMEIWKQKSNKRYGKIAQYNICQWSGKLGPKFVEGDRQAPEGFYNVTAAQMNPNSRYYLSFDLGFPNAYDRAHNRTGSNLMVHGSCSSAGCYSMTDQSVAQIYAFGRDAFVGGQRSFQVQAFPFRMTPQNMARYRNDSNYPFWLMLKQGYDAFENTKIPPKVDVCDGRYIFNSPKGCALSRGLESAFVTSFVNDNAAIDKAFSSAQGVQLKEPSPSIASRAEANLVADWSRRRASGQRVSHQPPSLATGSIKKQEKTEIPVPTFRN